MSTIFRIYYEHRGAHTHCRIFTGTSETDGALCGRLIMPVEAFDCLKSAILFADAPSDVAQFYFFPEVRNASVDDPATEDVVATWLSLPIARRTREALREALTK